MGFNEYAVAQYEFLMEIERWLMEINSLGKLTNEMLIKGKRIQAIIYQRIY